MSDPNEISSDEMSARRGSPAPGCCILSAIVVIFGGLILLYIVVGTYQNRSIESFTQSEPAQFEIPAPGEEAAGAARGKLQQVAEAVAAGRSERILFSAADLNALIATLEETEGFRGNTRIERIGPEGLSVSMAQPLRKGPFQKGFRYLNGEFVLQPELRARTIAFKVVAIHPAAGQVPEPFVNSYASLDLFRLDPDLPAVKDHVAHLDAVYLEGDQLVVETKVGQTGK